MSISNHPGKYVLAILLCLLTLGYTAAVVFGYIPEKQRIDLPNLILLILAGMGAVLMLKPDIVQRVTKFKMGDLELELDSLKVRQAKQARELNEISLILPLLLRDQETLHLRRLAAKNTKGYAGSHDLRTELRRLRTMGLIERPTDRRIAQITDGSPVDLADYVRLTAFGERWVEKIKEIDDDKKYPPDE